MDKDNGNVELYNECIECINNFSDISVFLAYNVNVDAIKFFKDGQEVQELIDQFDEKEIIDMIEKYPRKNNASCGVYCTVDSFYEGGKAVRSSYFRE